MRLVRNLKLFLDANNREGKRKKRNKTIEKVKNQGKKEIKNNKEKEERRRKN